MASQDGEQNLRYFGRLLARHFGKKDGIFVGNGTLALEVALRACNVCPGDEVIVPDNSCFLVPLSVVRINAIPVFVYTDKSLLLQPNYILDQINNKTKAIIAVHNYGLPCDIAALRSAVGSSLPIIEDAAQAWKIRYKGFDIGTHSDMVVTSLGETKPLSVGGGGAVFTDKMSLHQFIDCHSRSARARKVEPLPYALNPSVLSQLGKAMEVADCYVRERRYFVEQIISDIHSIEYETWTPALGDEPSWHRLPVFLPKKCFPTTKRFIRDFETSSIQFPHLYPLHELPIFKGRCRVQEHKAHDSCSSLVLIRPDEAALNPAHAISQLRNLREHALSGRKPIAG